MLDPQKKLDAPTLLLLGGILFWVSLYSLIGPRIGQDFFYFADAGVNFAKGDGLKEVSTYSNPTLEYKYYATYPPVYPFLYGMYTALFGVGDYQNTFFNIFLRLTRAILLFIIVFKYAKSWSKGQKFIITFLIILFAPSGNSYDRPEDLVTVFFLISLLLYLMRKYSIAFLIAGLNLMTSPVCGLVSAVILLGIYFHDVFREKVEWKALIEKSYPVLYMLVFPVIIIAILAFLDTSIFERFYNYVKLMREKIRPPGIDYLKFLITDRMFISVISFYSFLVALIFGIFIAGFAYKASEKTLASFILLVIGLVTLLNWEGRMNYYQHFSAHSLLIGIYILMLKVEKLESVRNKSFALFFGLLVLLGTPSTIRDVYVRFFPMNREKYESAKEQVRKFFKDKPKDFIQASPQYYFFLKDINPKICADIIFEDKYSPKYIVEYPQRKDSIIVLRSRLYRKVFETEKSVPNPQNTFWERLLMRPHETWYPVIYERIDEQ
jgi:lysylphosphatidylglycerol synthetase-like protein (DUF2156 family)